MAHQGCNGMVLGRICAEQERPQEGHGFSSFRHSGAVAGIASGTGDCGENDILRDEGEAYARKLLQSGVEVTAVRVLATHHDFALLNALADTPATKATVQLASQKLAEALSLAAPSQASA